MHFLRISVVDVCPSGGVFLPQDSRAIRRPSEMRWIRLTLRVQPLHRIEFLGRDLRQVPDEQNQAPGLRVSVRSVEAGMPLKRTPFSIV